MHVSKEVRARFGHPGSPAGGQARQGIRGVRMFLTVVGLRRTPQDESCGYRYQARFSGLATVLARFSGLGAAQPRASACRRAGRQQNFPSHAGNKPLIDTRAHA